MRTPPTPMVLTSLAMLAFWAYCLYDFTQADERDIRGFPRQVWLVVLVVGSVAGGALWMLAGRPLRPTRR